MTTSTSSPKSLWRHLLPPAFWLGAWQFFAWIIDLSMNGKGNELLLPYPGSVALALLELGQQSGFWMTVFSSLGRILAGMVLGCLLGVVLAALTCLSSLAHDLLSPAIKVIRATPVASFAILVLIWVNRDYVPVLICAMMGLPIVWNSVSSGIRMTDPQLLEMAKVYRLPKGRTLRRIWIPSVMPFFRTACSSALGLGWKAGIAAEVLTVPKRSIGRMISESKLYLLTEELFASTLMVIVLSLLLQKLMLCLLRGRDAHA